MNEPKTCERPDHKLPEPNLAAQCCRDTAKNLLDDRIRGLEYRVCQLKTIRAMLPTEMTAQQDVALWSLLIEAR